VRLSLQAKNIKSTRQVTSKERIELLFRRIRTILKWKVSSYESEKLETGFPLAKKCESGDVVCFSAAWLAARNLQICQISVSTFHPQ
jgi:hypothetical protein